jgi:hypothetical protein
MFRAPRVIIVGLALGLLGGCSSAKTGTGGSPAIGVTGVAASPTVPAVGRVAALQDALLVQADVSHGLAKGAYTVHDSVGPCGKPTMQSKYPKHKQIGATFGHGTSLAASTEVDEDVVVFANAATAESAYLYHVAELNCRQGSIKDGGTTVKFTISAPVNVVGQVGGQHAISWTVVAAGYVTSELLTVRLKDMVVDIGVVGGARVPAADVPDPLGLAKLAVSKLGAV